MFLWTRVKGFVLMLVQTRETPMLKAYDDYAKELLDTGTTIPEFLRAWRDNKFPGMGATYVTLVVLAMYEEPWNNPKAPSALLKLRD